MASYRHLTNDMDMLCYTFIQFIFYDGTTIFCNDDNCIVSYIQFLTLLRAVASSLELDDIGGLRSMAHIPRDERIRLARERESGVELLTSRIKVLIERIQRKDELLQGYEKDLAKLRYAP